jgi:hypothetical protein
MHGVKNFFANWCYFNRILTLTKELTTSGFFSSTIEGNGGKINLFQSNDQ